MKGYPKVVLWIFLLLAIINFVVQLSDKPLKLSNWVSAFVFFILALYTFFYGRKKD
jgi:uncharacterized protein with PQ loop repeat